jgi:hypothetical protein
VESLTLVFAGTVAFGLIIFVLEPWKFLPERKPEKKFLGASYWGVYNGRPTIEAPEQRTFEVRKPSRKQKAIAGSTTYAMGRGVNMSGRR